MTYPIYSIKDHKVGFMSPTVDQNDSSAIRNFSYAINNGGIMNFSPNDFDLYKIGYFDDQKGNIEEILPELVVSGSSVYGEKK